jgi:hypothetical protein
MPKKRINYDVPWVETDLLFPDVQDKKPILLAGVMNSAQKIVFSKTMDIVKDGLSCGTPKYFGAVTVFSTWTHFTRGIVCGRVTFFWLQPYGDR